MADPMSAMIIMAAGTGMDAFGHIAQGRASAASGSAEAAWREYNARVAMSKAEAERKAHRYEAGLHREEAERHKAQHRVAHATSGLDMDSPTSLLVRAESAAELERDALMIERTGRMRADHLESQAQLERMRGGHAQAMGRWERRMSRWQAGTSLLTGMGQTYMTGHRAGLWGGD